MVGPTLAGLSKLGPLPPAIAVHLNRAYDSIASRALLQDFGFRGQIARKGLPPLVQAGARWVVERSQAWMNWFGKLRR